MSRDATYEFSSRWLFLPPFAALITIFVAYMFSNGQVVPVDAALWGLVGLLFVVLTVLYGLFIRQDFARGLLPVQLIAQGLLLCPLSLRLGAGSMLQWVGVVMAVCGAVVLVAFFYFSRFSLRSRSLEEDQEALEMAVLPVPFAVTDAEGNVVSVSDALLALVHKERSEAEGGKITLLLPLGQEDIALDGRDWKILQTPMGRDRFCFQLVELDDSSATVSLSAQKPANADCFVDEATSLYTRSFALKRVTEELYRVRRYQRWMSATLLRMLFVYPGSNTQPEKEDAIFNAYCRFVHASTRETDISCLVGPRDILTVMPETSLEDAQGAAAKLADFAPQVGGYLEGFEGGIELRESTVFYGAGDGDLDFDGFLAKLDEAMGAP